MRKITKYTKQLVVKTPAKPLLPHLILALLSTLLISCHSAKDKVASAENNSQPQIMDTLVDDENTDWKKDHLSGHVKSVRQVKTIAYKGKKPKVSSSKTNFTPLGKWLLKDGFYGDVNTYKYNANGQLVEFITFRNETPILKKIYTYAEDGDILSIKQYSRKTSSPTEERALSQPNTSNPSDDGLYLRVKTVYLNNTTETDTVYKENSQIDYSTTKVYDENSRLIETERTYAFSSFGYKKTWEYDRCGNEVRFKTYTGADKELDYIFEYEYDKKNRLTQKTYLEYGPSHSYKNTKNRHLEYERRGVALGENSTITLYAYDKHGKLTSEIRKKYTGELIYKKTFEITYDDRQNLTQEVVVNSEGNNFTNSFKYDENGNEIYYKSETAKGEIIEKITRKFDDQNNLLERIEVGREGEILLKENYTYNNNSKVIKKKTENPQKQQLEIMTKVFDEVGNWINYEIKVFNSKTNELHQTITHQREIIYY